MADGPTRDQNKFIVRMPDGLRDRIKDVADANNRSMNAEIVARLEESLDPHASPSAQLQMYQDMYDQNLEERSRLFETINKQDLLLQQFRKEHETFLILAKSLGEAFLAQGDKSDVLSVLANNLVNLDVDVSSEPSEELPKQPWEE
ncbi:MAG: Arc family DNA-binding protein [Proteobacteria bacterium]|nr:Arc family DNA-binding protein [Pseudomonadota bacterium]